MSTTITATSTDEEKFVAEWWALDYAGQALAENINTGVALLFTIVGFIYGFMIQEFSVALYVSSWLLLSLLILLLLLPLLLFIMGA